MYAVTLDVPKRTDARPTFAAVAEEHLDDVYGYLLYLTKDWTRAEDLTSETFETALRRWNRFDPRRGTARSWLLTIARSAALDSFRAESRRRRREARAGAEPLTSEDTHAFGESVSPELEEGLRSLAAGEREVILLRIVLELDGEETARLLGITPTAVSTRLHRALGKLEERMRSHERVA